VSPKDKARIERAARLVGEPVTSFARSAAEERAERILREYEATTTVPAKFFDELMAALDARPKPNAALRKAAAKLHKTITRD
jgi:uncharacterized protein (DUF1778 family)